MVTIYVEPGDFIVKPFLRIGDRDPPLYSDFNLSGIGQRRMGNFADAEAHFSSPKW